MLVIENLMAGYNKIDPIIKGLSFRVEKGENILISGSNGSGKSTLAKAIMGVLPFCEGNIFLDGVNIRDFNVHQRQRQGALWLMQRNTIFEFLTVQENIDLAMSHLSQHWKKQKKIKFGPILKNFKSNKKAAFLSGGEKRLLSLILVLLASSKVKCIILDEPSAGVSQKGFKDLIDSFKFLIDSSDSSVLLIEHNNEFVSRFSYTKKIDL